ncbi:MAG TPA: hypothetical protein PK794_14090, partial [Armatimonadota bacterium]|nr:hypothetical protein [Armatimonadota bacterium]
HAMNTVQRGYLFLAACALFQLLGRGIAAGGPDMTPLALLALAISYAAGAVGLYRVLVALIMRWTRPPAPFTLDRPAPSLLRYRRDGRTMIIPLALGGRVPRLHEAAIGRWEPPHDRQSVNDDDRAAILHDIILHLAEREEAIEIVRAAARAA